MVTHDVRSDIFKTIIPYFYVSKVFGFANFSINSRTNINKKCKIKLLDVTFMLMSIILYTANAFMLIFIFPSYYNHTSKIIVIGDKALYIVNWCISMILVCLNFVFREKFIELFSLIKALDCDMSKIVDIDVNSKECRKFSIKYLIYSDLAMIVISIATDLHDYSWKVDMRVILTCLYFYDAFAYAVYTGQFSLTLLLIKRRYFILNSIFR